MTLFVAARHIPTGQIVALKKVGGWGRAHQLTAVLPLVPEAHSLLPCLLLQVRFSGSKEGLPVTSVRELAILQQARHPNIVSLLKVVTGTRPDRCAACGALAVHSCTAAPCTTGLCSCNSVNSPLSLLVCGPSRGLIYTNTLSVNYCSQAKGSQAAKPTQLIPLDVVLPHVEPCTPLQCVSCV